MIEIMTPQYKDFSKYILLWDIKDQTTPDSQLKAFEEAEEWPGFQKNLIDPTPIRFDLRRIGMTPVKPDVPPLGGRKTDRRFPPHYTSLSNYNNIP
jgi:hypothetical protein